MWKRKRPLALLLVLALVLIPATPVSGQPLPHAFYGTLTVGGAPAAAGSTVTAVVTGGGGEITTTTAGQYGGPNMVDEKLTVAGDIEIDALIEFFVDGNQADQTARFRAGRTTELNLSVPGPPSYNLLPGSTAGGVVTTPGEPGPFTYVEGTVVTLLATPVGGFEFVNWSGNTATIGNANAASTTITMNGNYSVTANFTAIQRQLTTASSAGGSVTNPGEGPFTYDHGTVVALLAVPASGFEFVNWSGNTTTIANVNAASTTITMNGNYSVTANFTPIQRQLTTASSAGGSVTDPGEGTNTYDDGTVVALLAVPAGNFEFVNWSGDITTIANVNAAGTTITMDGDYSVTANFAVIQRQLTSASGAGGVVTAPGDGATYTYDDGAVVTLLAVSDGDFEFLNWTGDTATIANVNAAGTTIVMYGDYSVTANFVTGAVWIIELCPGWNTFSVPIAPDESMDTWGELGANLALDPNAVAYYFDSLNQAWGLVQANYPIVPGDAIYLKMATADTVAIMPTEAPTISARQLYAGWNLVGLAYIPWQENPVLIPGMKADEALSSVEEVTGGLPGYVTVVSPPLCQEPWVYSGGNIADWNGQPPAPEGWLLIGKGYWVYMLNDGVLAGFTSTPVNW